MMCKQINRFNNNKSNIEHKLLKSKVNRQQNYKEPLNVVKMMKKVKMIKKFQELIIQLSMQTYKLHKILRIYSNISRGTSHKR